MGACATLSDVCEMPMVAERTTALLKMLGKCSCPHRVAVLDAAVESFCATYTFTASSEVDGGEDGDTTGGAPAKEQHLSAPQQEALKSIVHLPELGLLVFGRM